MNDLTLPLSGLSSVGGRSVVARFDGGMVSSDSGVLALAEVEKRLRVAERLARCLDDPRKPDQVIHNFADMIGFRMKMIAAGYEVGNDANRLRSDPVFKMAQDAPPQVIDWCRANDIDFILGVAPTTTLRKHVADLEAGTTARFEASAKTGKVRRFKQFLDGAASWSRVERIIARVEVGAQGADTRFIVTNLAGGKAKALYADLYCRRGAAENHIKSWKTHLAADRTSCTRATANQFRLFLHAGAYWLMWGLRAAMPKRSSFAVAQFDTLRLRLIKIAARVVEMKTQIRLHLPTSCPDQPILRIVLDRIPRLAT